MTKGGLSKDPYKGVRDFYPGDMAILSYVFGVMRKTAESYGYVEYGASPLEPAELYESKTSEEIVNEQTYTFTDRGERRVTLRPEMTPTLARMVAARKRELPLPIRWYSIPNVFRYESPQRGRLREHYQLNVDLLGISGIEAEAEIIMLAYRIMRNLGARDSDFEIKINSRKNLEKNISSLIKEKGLYKNALRLLDKKDKLSAEEFKKEWSLLSNHPAPKDIPENNEIKVLLKKLELSGVKNVTYAPLLVRGFDYYTDIVFEVFDTNKENRRSLFGGGRFDELLSIFGEEDVPAVGFGMGDVTIRDFLETHNLLQEVSSKIDICVCLTEDSDDTFVRKITENWREFGVNVAVDWTGRKVGDQIKSASKSGVRFIVVLGKEELEKGAVRVKKLEDGSEKELKISDVSSFIKKEKQVK